MLALIRQHGNVSRAADAQRVPRATMQSRWDRAKRYATAIGLPVPPLTNQPLNPDAVAAVPVLPDEVATIDELLERRRREFDRKHEAKEARKLVPVPVKIDGPFGLALFGDPHVDDPGTDIRLLESHMALVKRTPGLLAGNVGDYSNNWVGRLARLHAEQSTTAAEAWVLVEWLVRYLPWMFLIGGNHDCLDTDTDVLTRRGWVQHTDLRPDDRVFGRNPSTGLGEWQPILQIIERENTEPMVAIDAGSVSMRVTPKHRVLHDTRNWTRQWRQQWRYCTADSLPGSFRLRVALSTDSPGVDINSCWLELAGWVLTDGSIQYSKNPGRTPRVSIWQSKPSPRLEQLIAACGFSPRVVVRNRAIRQVAGRVLRKKPRPQREYRFSAAESRRLLEVVPAKGSLPSWALDLTDHQFERLLDGLIAGDGCWDGADPSARRCGVLHGTRAFLESVQAVAVQHGWRAVLAVARQKDYRLNLLKKSTVEFHRSASVTSAAPSPKVWCLTVPFGNFMVRREGKPLLTGNCWSGAGDPVKWMARSARVAYESNGMRLGLQAPNGRVIRLNCRHNWKGYSMWNPAHGPAKAVQRGHRDHLVVAGHLHISGYNQLRDPMSGLISHALRIGSYKIHDRYAEEQGLESEQISPAVVVVVQPDRADDDPGLLTVFHDVETGADFLTFLRGRKRTRAA